MEIVEGMTSRDAPAQRRRFSPAQSGQGAAAAGYILRFLRRLCRPGVDVNQDGDYLRFRVEAGRLSFPVKMLLEGEHYVNDAWRR